MEYEYKEKYQSFGYVLGTHQHVLRYGCGWYSLGRMFQALSSQNKKEGTHFLKVVVGRLWEGPGVILKNKRRSREGDKH